MSSRRSLLTVIADRKRQRRDYRPARPFRVRPRGCTDPADLQIIDACTREQAESLGFAARSDAMDFFSISSGVPDPWRE